MKKTIVLGLAGVAWALAGTAASAAIAVGSGTNLFNLDSLPTGPSGTQAVYQPNQDYTAIGLPVLPGTQGVLNQTVNGLTLSVRTPDFVYNPANPSAQQTGIRVENDSGNFGYLGVPSEIQVGITTFGPNPPAAIFANFSDAIQYFSVDTYRLSGGFSFDVTLTAYSGLNGTGDVLGTVTGSLSGGNNFAYTLIELGNIGGTHSVALQGSTFLPNYDMITATLGDAAPAVPEPATWGLMMLGFGLVGGALRSRRRLPTALA